MTEKNKLLTDIQRLNMCLLKSQKIGKCKSALSECNMFSDEESNDSQSDVCSNLVDELDEMCMILFWLKRLFHKEPELVNRVILEIRRYFKNISREGTCLAEAVKFPSKHCLELETLRMYIKNEESIPKPLGNPKTVNFFDQFHIMKKAGIGLPVEDIFNLSMSIHYLLGMTPHITKIRFWGKINGIFRDYYILECDLSQEEIDTRNEKKQEVLEKVRSQSLTKSQPKFQFLSTGSKTRVPDEAGDKSSNICDDNKSAQSTVNETSESKVFETHELDLTILNLKKAPSKFETFKISDRPGIPFVEDWVVPEDDVGFGTNKKLYLVSNNSYNNWCELPNITPHQIVVARKIKRHFSGILEQKIDTCPTFPGTEKNYLRAQIARISARTQISPLGYYHFNLEEELPEEDEELPNKPAGCTLNEDYFPMLMSELGAKTALDFWAHHTEYILKQGRTVFWKPFAAQQGEEGGESSQQDAVPKGPDVLTPISNDITLNGIQPWTISCKSKLFPDSATAVVRSNIWPGAFAYAHGTFADTVYLGWGHKLDPFGLTPPQPNFSQTEYEVGPDVMESTDPTVEETLAWIEMNTPKPPPPIDMLGEGEEHSPGEDDEEDEEEEEDEDD